MTIHLPQSLIGALARRTQLREQCETARYMHRIATSQCREAKDMMASARKMFAAAQIIRDKMRAVAAA